MSQQSTINNTPNPGGLNPQMFISGIQMLERYVTTNQQHTSDSGVVTQFYNWCQQNQQVLTQAFSGSSGNTQAVGATGGGLID